MALITTPSQVTDTLYHSKLEPEQPEGSTRSGTLIQLGEEELPDVEIGRPQWWNIPKLYSKEGKSLPATIRLLLNEADFFLVQLACTLYPNRAQNTRITWARFTVDLRPQNNTSPLPIAFDLHPERVEEKKRHDVHVTFSPSFKFAEFEASLGEATADIHYTELIPVITAGGALSNRFSWELRATDHYPLSGVRWFHVIVKSPRQAGGVQARFNLRAQILTPRGLGLGALGKSKSDAHDNRLCIICI